MKTPEFDFVDQAFQPQQQGDRQGKDGYTSDDTTEVSRHSVALPVTGWGKINMTTTDCRGTTLFQNIFEDNFFVLVGI